ncbi:MAG: DUF3592 domain-containing protein [Chlorobia bacterium]|nr:DUF3592 domain-containing protein [Fimbriimonadaceae bacterium]
MKLPLRGRLLLAAVVAPVVGCLMIGISWSEWSVHSRLEKQGVEVTGNVEKSERKSRKRNSSYLLVVAYPAQSGTVQGNFTAKSEVGQAHPVASPIRVVYDPSDASAARLKDSLYSKEFQMIMLLGLGIFAVGPALALIAWRLPK